MSIIKKPYLSYDVIITLHNKDNTKTIVTEEDLDEYTMEKIQDRLWELEEVSSV